ncbi:MAG: hypothetical protein KH284_13310 [Clostridiales bacterium]|nr:hypothetical protein [Clostridiales bacterium]
MRQEAFRADRHFSNASNVSFDDIFQQLPSAKMALPPCGRRRFAPTGIFPMHQTFRLMLLYHIFAVVRSFFRVGRKDKLLFSADGAHILAKDAARFGFGGEFSNGLDAEKKRMQAG